MTSPVPTVLLSKNEVRDLAAPPGPPPDAYAVRERWRLGYGTWGYPMPQTAFAALLGIPVTTVREWEQGRRKPDAAAARLLALFAAAPEEMKAALAKLAGCPPGGAALP